MSSKWCMEVIHRFEEILNFVRNKWKSSIDSISPRSTISHNITFIIDAYWRPIKNYANEKFCGCESKIEHISQLNSKLSISIDNDCHTRDIMQIQSDTWFVKIEFNACIRMAERQSECFFVFLGNNSQIALLQIDNIYLWMLNDGLDAVCVRLKWPLATN